MADHEAVSRYARAFVSIIAKRGEALELFGEFQELSAEFIGNKAVVHYFMNPSVLTRDKVQMVSKMLAEAGASDIVSRMMITLVKNNRFNILKYLSEPVRRILFEELGMVEVQLTVPTPLSKEMETRFKAAFEKKTGKQVILRMKVDSGLIGGAVARIGSVLIDGSIKTNLIKIREKLTGENQWR